MDEIQKLRKISEIKRLVDCDVEILIRTKGTIDTVWKTIETIVERE